MTPLLVGVPVKPFGVAKARLAGVLDRRGRSRVGRAIAARTVEIVVAGGADPAVVTGDPGVARWAHRHGWRVVTERPGGGLDGAGDALVSAAAGRPWAFLHADLPLLTRDDLAAAWSALTDGPVLAPSHDGGTSLVAAVGPMRFSYGPGSFHRHLAAVPTATVIARPGLALDLDTAADLDVVLRLSPNGWLADLVEPPVAAAAQIHR